jgi:hypothetical protein
MTTARCRWASDPLTQHQRSIAVSLPGLHGGVGRSDQRVDDVASLVFSRPTVQDSPSSQRQQRQPYSRHPLPQCSFTD